MTADLSSWHCPCPSGVQRDSSRDRPFVLPTGVRLATGVCPMSQKALVALWTTCVLVMPFAASAATINPVVVTWNIDSVEAGKGTDVQARAAMGYVASVTPLPQIVVVQEALQSQFATYI